MIPCSDLNREKESGEESHDIRDPRGDTPVKPIHRTRNNHRDDVGNHETGAQ